MCECGNVKEAEARPRCLNERDVTRTRLRRCALECAGPIAGWSNAEVSTKRARKYFVAVEADCNRHIQDGAIAGHEPGCRPLQLETQSVLLGCFADHRAECAVQVKRRPSCTRR
jgi:hypothetical protein